MTSSELISNGVITLLPFLALLCAYLYKIIFRRLPENQIPLLKPLAEYAVHNMEQTFGNVPGPQKKQMAEEYIVEAFKALDRPVPSMDLVRGAIESVVLIMNNMPQIAAAKEDINPIAPARIQSDNSKV